MIGKTNQFTTLKDINFLIAANASQDLIDLHPEDNELVLDAIRKDVRFLQKHNLMDYSLLLSVET